METKQQLREELSDRAHALCALLGGTEPEVMLHRLIDANADEMLAEASEPDGALAIMDALWGSCEPPAEWWATPLGRLLGADSGITITQQEAANLRGVTRGTITTELKRGTIRAGENGRGVVVADVVKRFK